MTHYGKTMTNKEKVEIQYKNGNNLSQRISIHEKYSTNPEGLTNWLFRQYTFNEQEHVLELGSGTGAMWSHQLESLPKGIQLTVSDFTDGMVAELTKNFKPYDFVKVQKIDIQSLPFEDHTFDLIIANFMLYHVPDLHNALSEVTRVLKPNGCFYAATVGDKHLMEINQWVGEFNSHLDIFNSSKLSFRLQNGKEILNQYFNEIEIKEYEDSLLISSNEDLVQYICTFKDMSDVSDGEIQGLSDFLESKRNSEKVFQVSKQSGTFVCRNKSSV